MLLVGLTGGMGAGKSTVARMLESRGAVVIDADVLARQALLPGTPGYTKVTELFGPDIIGPDGDIDRAALAKRVFSNDEARVALESITHPEVFRLLSESLEDYQDTDRIVVFDAPLIVEAGFQDACDAIVVVISPEEAQLARVMEERGMTEDAARARLRAQAPTAEKERVADFVIRNDGTIEELENAVDALWNELSEAARAKGAGS
ncbi:MAG TPA: dephospho-CoA kinase [Actinomycetota bacterium]|nr:dephospho-CoA kinase [Actinomycetota bacterium]